MMNSDDFRSMLIENPNTRHLKRQRELLIKDFLERSSMKQGAVDITFSFDVDQTQRKLFPYDHLIKSFHIFSKNSRDVLFTIAPIPHYCGAYTICHFYAPDITHQHIVCDILLSLYPISGDIVTSMGLCMYKEPKFIIYDKLNSDNLSFLKENAESYVDLGTNNNSGNHTSMWVLSEESIKKAKSQILKIVQPATNTKEESAAEILIRRGVEI